MSQANNKSIIKQRPIRYKLITKVLLTLLGVLVIPIIVTNIVMNNFISIQLSQVVEEDLKEGREYVESILNDKATSMVAGSVRISEDTRLIKYLQNLLEKKEENIPLANIYEAMYEYGISYIAILDSSLKKIFELSFTIYPEEWIGINREFIDKGTGKLYLEEKLVDKGFLYKTSSTIELDSKNLHVITATLLSRNFADRIKNSINIDISYIKNDVREITTLYNAYGESLQGTKIELPDKYQNENEKEEGVIIEGFHHLKKEYLSFYYISQLKGTDDTLTTVIAKPLPEETSKEIQNYLLILSFIMVLFVGIAGTYLALGIINPVQMLISKISEASDKLSKGEKIEKINIKNRDELRVLAETFNSMISEIQIAYQEIKNYTDNLEKMVNDRTSELNETNRMMKHEVDMTATIQKALLPKSLIETNYLSIAHRVESMTQVCGDFVDVFTIDKESIGVLSIDVSGHVVLSALVTTMTKIYFSNIGRRIKNDPALISKEVYKEIVPILNNAEFFLSAFFGIINIKEKTFHFTNTGHPPALHYSTVDSVFHNITTKGFVMGSDDEPAFESERIKIFKGDKIVLHSDGFYKVEDPEGNKYGNERFLKTLEKNIKKKPEVIIEKIFEDLNQFQKEASTVDDKSVLIVEVK